ncbi:MAG: DUF58 domain-containing protein [Bacteroidetes bacterium]|nr:DUF58 domain-containing protein [Bacteroidota bacterium]
MNNPNSTSPLKYLDPVMISRLNNMELRARLVVEGFITGLHKSPYHGFSVEFAEHRLYNPGDALRHVDWKVYAKTDRYYVKQYEEETNLHHYILLDTSASMQYRHAGQLSKLQYSTYLAAALHYLMIQQRDATGLLSFDSEVRTFLRPRSTMRYLREILLQLERLESSRSSEHFTGTAHALHQVAERVQRRSLIVLISDLIDDDDSQDQIIRALRHLRHKGHEVLIFRILEKETEALFNLPNRPMILRDMESGVELSLNPSTLRNAYIERMHDLSDALKRQCRKHSIDYVELDTQVSYDKALLAYLNKRKTLH